jgi:hypothetical protein
MSTIPIKLLVNRSAIERITGVPARRIVSFELQFDDLVIVTVKPSRAEPAPRIKVINMAQLEADFESHRHQAGAELVLLNTIARSNSTVYFVEGNSGNVYQITDRLGSLECECMDWREHQTVCKHGWAVLHSLGHDSLEAWIKSRPVAVQPIEKMPVNAGRVAPTYFRGKSID